MKTRLHILALTLACSLQPAALLLAAPAGTAFTYQGRLDDGGQPASGSYDLKFTLYDAEAEASLVGGPITNAATAVSNGLFTVTLDFGPGVFTGEARWLEIGVRANGSPADFTTLAPRQPLTPSPHALYAPNAGSAVGVTGPVAASQLTGTLASSNIGVGTITAPQLASGAALANINASGQSAVPIGGVVLSEVPTNANLLNAGYVKIGEPLVLVAEKWTKYADGPPDTGQPFLGRSGHSAVWTGSEMIIWGGYDGSYLNDGSRYDPAINVWTPLPNTDAPEAQAGHSAVWTGSRMVVWGKMSGGRYNPSTQTWSPVSTVNSPSGAEGKALWCGNRMVFIGYLDEYGGSGWNAYHIPYDIFLGGRYNATTDTWSSVNTNGAPSGRGLFSAVWTGRELLVWGGKFVYESLGGYTDYLSSGARYDPASDTWTDMSTTGAPAARYGASAVWTGTEMIVWGGRGSGSVLSTGGRYSPSSDSWSSTSLTSVPAARTGHTAVWTGSRMVIWGGVGSDDLPRNTGGRYDPSANNWSSITTVGAPAARFDHTAVWSSTQMLVWGGRDSTSDTLTGYPEFGGRYDPTNNNWTAMTSLPARFEPGARQNASAVWTGAEMLIWGGENDGLRLRSGGKFNLAANSWSSLPMSNAPPACAAHTAVWTGAEMIIWGCDGANFTGPGIAARYKLAQGTWVALSTNGAPKARLQHSAAWTGSEMIVWGGYRPGGRNGLTFLNDGGRYSPSADTWQTVNLTEAPSIRAGHTAVWTGDQMLVWGGWRTSVVFETNTWTNFLYSGACYSPGLDVATNSTPWTAMTTVGAPSGRTNHTAIWTGREMIVWGGKSSTVFGTGGRYDPAADSWRTLSTSGTPGAREGHVAVWDGSRMIIYGGEGISGPIIAGAFYDAAADAWSPMTTTGAPPARRGRPAVWTGHEMLLWGGRSGLTYTNATYGYTPPRTVYLYLKP